MCPLHRSRHSSIRPYRIPSTARVSSPSTSFAPNWASIAVDWADVHIIPVDTDPKWGVVLTGGGSTTWPWAGPWGWRQNPAGKWRGLSWLWLASGTMKNEAAAGEIADSVRKAVFGV